MRTDDLGPLFNNEPPRGVGFRQGTILSFDQITLKNQVLVGDQVMTDLPLLGIAEAVTLAQGDVVGLMVVNPSGGAATLGILGQWVLPNSPEAAGAISVPSLNTYSATVAAFETRTSDIWGDLATVGPVVSNVRIGPSGRCLVFMTSTIGLLGTDGGGEMAYEITGATTVPTGDTPPSVAFYGAVGSAPTMTAIQLQESLNPGLHTFTAKYSAVDFGAGGSARFGGRNLTVMAL